jgi:NAD(P)-dependent dehydrogenase (short-subunit alcohol dehydrogenase family)
MSGRLSGLDHEAARWPDRTVGVFIQDGSSWRGTPAGRSGTPDAVAHAAVYLASDEAAFVHGSVIDVDGGRTGVAVVAS